MPRPPLPPHLLDLLRSPNPSVIATLRPDGQPVTVATWYLLDDDGRILVNMDAGRRRLEYIRQDPRVSLTVLDGDNWSTHVSVQGRLVDLTDDADLSDIDRIATHYTGNAYPMRSRGRVSGWIDVDFWHAWGPAPNRGPDDPSGPEPDQTSNPSRRADLAFCLLVRSRRSRRTSSGSSASAAGLSMTSFSTW